MQKINITIQPLSYLLVSAGNGSGLIDSEMEFHKNGFPFFRAKAFKGLLKESLTEILEITKQDTAAIKLLFGNEGYNPGRLRFPENFYPADWRDIKSYTSTVKTELTCNYIKKYFTQVINQTKISDDGVAEDFSLRTIGVMRPEVNFYGNIYLDDDDEGDILDEEEIQQLIQLSFKNLRYCGRQRNRGLGRVKVTGDFKKVTMPDLQPASMQSKNVNVFITALTPVLLTKKDANANTVFSRPTISGSQLRGILAHRYINFKKDNNAVYDADKDDDFYNIFLSGKIKFRDCLPDGALPLSQNWQVTKADKTNLVNVFELDKEDERRFFKEAYIDTSTFSMVKHKTTFNFHHSRKNRTAGRSTEDTGAIYYYESIDEDQKFEGSISGDEGLLSGLFKVAGNSFTASLGKSKGVQYGSIQIDLRADEEGAAPIKGKVFQVVVRTPIILLNQYGMPQISNILLQQAVQKIKPELLIDQEKLLLSSTEVEQYVVLWQVKSGKKIAIKEGSTFIIKSGDEIELQTKYSLGALQEQGFGEVIITSYNAEDVRKKLKNFAISAGDNIKKKPAIIDQIENYTKHCRHEVALKTTAIKKANNANKKLSNSFISRLIEVFNNSNNDTDVNAEIQRAAEKKFGKTLLSEGFIILNKDVEVEFLFSKYINFKTHPFSDIKIFWIEFLKTLRLQNQKQ